MKYVKVLLDFILLSVGDKIAFYRNIIDKLTGNPTFSDPDVSLSEAITSVNDLEAAVLAASDGSHTANSILHETIGSTDRTFRILAAYIDRKSKGIESTILSSGFHATRQPNAPQKEQFYIIDGDNTGCVHLFSKPTPRAGAYIWQMYKGSIPLNEADWITIGHTTRADLEVSGLEATAIYYFRNCAITPDGKTDYCAPVKKIVI